MEGILASEIVDRDQQEVRDSLVTNTYQVFGKTDMAQPQNEYGQNQNNKFSCDGYRATLPAEAQATALKDKIAGCTSADYPDLNSLSPSTPPTNPTLPSGGIDPTAQCTGSGVADEAYRYGTTKRYAPEPETARQNFNRYKGVIDQVIDNSGIAINKALFYAFWIEETMASAVFSTGNSSTTTFGLGCRGDYIPGNPYGDEIGLNVSAYRSDPNTLDATLRAHVDAQARCMAATLRTAISEVGTDPKALYDRYIVIKWGARGQNAGAIRNLLDIYGRISPACGVLP
jgi:hypothetical protein